MKTIKICPECNPNGSNYLIKSDGILVCGSCGWKWTLDKSEICNICQNGFEVGYHIGNDEWLKHDYPACLEQQTKTTKRRERKRDKLSLSAYKSADKRNEIKRKREKVLRNGYSGDG